ncbi:MAG: LysR family transcriptional regulator, partial [Maritimibacter sp.]|nr:LysR family transcriptional regulator [Maritimibacter sp.]
MLPSTFRQLEVFLAVIDAGGVSGAAARLEVSPATVSNHIKALEKQMGTALFDRARGRRLVLTEPGRRVQFRARELMRQAELLARELQPNRPSARPRLTVIAQRFLASSFLSNPIGAFAEQNPDVELVFETDRLEAIMAKVAAGECDLAYVIANDDRIEHASRVVGRERLGFFAAPGHEAVAQAP